MGNILIKDAIVVPMYEVDGVKYFRGSVGIEGNVIAMIDRDATSVDDFRRRHEKNLYEIDGRGFVVMPGLINTHCHTPMTLMRSYADDQPLMTWLKEYIWPFENRMTEDDIRLRSELGVAEMLLGGTTCFVDMYFQEKVIAGIVDKSGMRAVLSTTLMGENREKFEKDLETLVSAWGKGMYGGRITPMVACHSPYTVSRDSLIYTKKIAKQYKLGFNIHVAETRDEIDMLDRETGMSPVVYLDSLGILDASTLAVHCVHVTDEDIRILSQRGVSVSHNPQSNMKLSSGIAPIAQMVGNGVNVTIGTDGASSNNDLDMLEEMRSASFLQKVSTGDPCTLPAWNVLKMATVNAAKAIGHCDSIGQLKVGMLADMIMIDMDKPHLNPQTDIVANLVYCAKSGDVDTVIVDGNILVEHGILKDWDMATLYGRVNKRVDDIRHSR